MCVCVHVLADFFWENDEWEVGATGPAARLCISEGSVRWEPPRVESSLKHSRIKVSVSLLSAPCLHRLCLHRDPVGDLCEYSARMHATISVTSHRVLIGDICTVTRVGGLCKFSKSRRRYQCDGCISVPFCLDKNIPISNI